MKYKKASCLPSTLPPSHLSSPLTGPHSSLLTEWQGAAAPATACTEMSDIWFGLSATSQNSPQEETLSLYVHTTHHTRDQTETW